MQKKIVRNRILSFFLSLVMVACLTQPAIPAVAQGNTPVPPQTGHASQYDYLQYDAGAAGTLYVNQYTTKPHVRRNDLTLGGNRMPVDIEFWYDEENLSSDLTAFANPYGYGWMTSYNQLLEYRSADEQYAFRNANGTWIYFEDSEEVTEDEASIWTEAALSEEALTGAILYLEKDALCSDLTSVTIEQEEKILHFDAAGRLISVIDSYNNTLTITYANQTGPSISMVTDGVGRRYVFTYANGWLSSVACQDGQGTPIAVQNTAISVSYTITNGLLLETSPGANYTYDSSRCITSLWGRDGIGYALTYSTGSQEVTSVTKQAAMDTQAPLTGTITEITKSSTQVTVTEGDLEQVQTYDLFGRPLTYVINQLVEEGGITVSNLLYGFNYIYENVQQSNGSYISQLTDIEFFDNSSLNDPGNEPGEEPETDPEDPEEDPEEPEEDPEEFGSYTEIRDQYGNITSETHTVPGTITDFTQTTLYTYSFDGNYLASVTNEDGITTTYSYNSLSGILQSVTDALNHTTGYSYNALRELTAASLPVTGLSDDTGMSAAYTYEDGRISTVEYGAFTYSFTYDAWGNITEVELNDDSLITYNYGTAADKGLVQSLTYGNGQQVFYSYNSLDQITGIGYTGQLNRFTYSYFDGKLASIEDSVTGQTTMYTEDGTELYDSEDNLLFSLEAGEEEGISEKTVFGVEWEEEENSQTDGTYGITTKQFSRSRENEELISGDSQYDALGRHSGTAVQSGDISLSESKNYSASSGQTGNLVSGYSVGAANNDTLTGLTGNYSYTYDANGNLLQESRSFSVGTFTPLDAEKEQENRIGPRGGILPPDKPPQPALWDLSGSTSYTYDEAGQIKSVVCSDGTNYNYTYDSSGNILTKVKYPGTLWPGRAENKSFVYNTDGLLTGYSESALGIVVTYTLDAMGNPVSVTKTSSYFPGDPFIKTLTWGEGRMLTSITTDEDNYILYTYNADGLRIQKTVCEEGIETVTDYIWSVGRLQAERCEDRIITILYDADNSPVGFTVEETESGITTVEQYSYLKNLQGDITHIIDIDGETVAAYQYGPWGERNVKGDADIAALNPCSYRGYYYDQETGYYYLQSRYYDPYIGRFLNADEAMLIGADGRFQTINLFTYCANNPIIISDETGAAAINIVFAAVGSVVGWILGDYVAKQLGYYSGVKYWVIRAGIIVGGAVIGWFAGTLLTRILANYLRSRPDIIFKLVAAKGGATVYTVLQFLGINPFTLAQNGSKFIGILRAFNAAKVTLTYDWAIKVYYKAKQLGYSIELHAPEKGYTWHIHFLANGSKLEGLHVQITKSAWDYLQNLLR